MTATPPTSSRPEPPLADTLSLMMPDVTVALLLRAALLDTDAAREAWTRWRDTTVDPKAFLAADRVGIKRHLPLLYHNLTRHGIDIGRDLEPYFRAARAREELRGERYRRYLGQALGALHGADIPFVVGKGVTVGETIHDDPVLRHSHDIDLLVRTSDLSAAGEALVDAGFNPSLKSNPGDELRFDHESGLPVELHDRLYCTPFYDGNLDRVWQHAIEGWMFDMPVKLLDDVTLLVQTPVHASTVPQRHGLSWIVDVITLLRKSKVIDWDAVVTVANGSRASLPLYAAYRYLVDTFDAAIPVDVVKQLRDQASRADKLRHLAVIEGLRVGPNDRFKPLWQASDGASRRAMTWALLAPPTPYLKAAHPDVGPITLAFLYAARPLVFLGKQLNKARYRLSCRCFGDPVTRDQRAFEKRLFPEERLLLGCLRQSLSMEEARALAKTVEEASIDWELVEENAREQGVAPLLFSNLRRCRAAGLLVPADVLSRFRGAMFRAIKTKEEHGRWLGHVLAHTDAHNLDVMIVKGAALDLEVLDTPWHVVSLDIDLLIREHYENLSDAICEPIWNFNSQGPLECDFATHHDLSIDELLPIDYPRMWSQAKRVDLNGRGVWLMSPEDMLITACTDACRKRFFHLKNLFSLRAILDRFDEMDWDRVVMIARAQHCTGIVYAALWSVRLATGMTVDNVVLRRFRPRPWLRAWLIRWLVARRSFTPVTHRSAVQRKDFSLAEKGVFSVNNLSLLLVYSAYTPVQAWRRIRWLSRKPEKNKPGMFTEKHADRARESVATPPPTNLVSDASNPSMVEASRS